MTAADVDAVCALEVALFPVDFWPRHMFVDELSQPRPGAIRRRNEGRIVGYAGLMCVNPPADVQTIAVVPECEGRASAVLC